MCSSGESSSRSDAFSSRNVPFVDSSVETLGAAVEYIRRDHGGSAICTVRCVREHIRAKETATGSSTRSRSGRKRRTHDADRAGRAVHGRKIFAADRVLRTHNISTLLSTNGTFLDEKASERLLDSPLEHIT